MQQKTDGILQRVSELNRRYEANDCNGTKDSEKNYKIISGKVPVLISAPHAVRQLRDGKMKERDGMTGGIVEYLCERFGAWGVVRTWNAQDDPNYGDDERSKAYRKLVADLVRVQGIDWMFDIHGCRDEYGFDMDAGVNGGENLLCSMEELEKVAECWRRLGLDVRIDEKFGARGLQTVSNVTHRATGINCVQLELSRWVRTSEAGLAKFFEGIAEIFAHILHV